MKPIHIPTLSLACCLLVFAADSEAVTLNYTNVDPAGILDTTVGVVPARLISVTGDDLILQAGTSLTINVGFENGQALVVSPAADPPGVELLNLAFVSPSVNGTPPSALMTGTVAVTAGGDFNPGSGVPSAFTQVFTPNSPLASTDVILLRWAGNPTDSGYVLKSLQYQIDVPAGFADYPTTRINLLVTGGAFSVVPVPAALPLFLSALFGTAAIRRRRRSDSVSGDAGVGASGHCAVNTQVTPMSGRGHSGVVVF